MRHGYFREKQKNSFHFFFDVQISILIIYFQYNQVVESMWSNWLLLYVKKRWNNEGYWTSGNSKSLSWHLFNAQIIAKRSISLLKFVYNPNWKLQVKLKEKSCSTLPFLILSVVFYEMKVLIFFSCAFSSFSVKLVAYVAVVIDDCHVPLLSNNTQERIW